jgi:hypothetical protein
MPNRYHRLIDDRAVDAHCSTSHCRQTIPPAQQFKSKRTGSTVVEVSGSHAAYVSKREVVAAFIEQAAKGVKLPAK